jgi:hypothetical protein
VDGQHWQKYNEVSWGNVVPSPVVDVSPTPILHVAPEVLLNCGYAVDAQGQQTIDTLLPTCAQFINEYGVGHPSALVLDNEIWLYYYDSRGNWSTHGIFVVKSWDGFHFMGPPQRTNLPNGVSVRYCPSSNLFIALTNIGASNVMFVSNDGIQWMPSSTTGSLCGDLCGLDLRVAVADHCCSPGPNTIVSDPHGHLTDLSMNVFSAEGFLGTGDGGRQLGCYSAKEDEARGSTWHIHLIQGTLAPLSSAMILPTGPFNVDLKEPIYYSDGRGHYCWYANWSEFETSGYAIGEVRSLTKIPSQMEFEGYCENSKKKHSDQDW